MTTTFAAPDARQLLTACESELTERNDVLQSIDYHESRLTALRAKLPTAIKRFYRFRCKPEPHVWVYASSREQATERLNEKMNASYGAGNWSIASSVVDVYDSPADAAPNAPGSLFRSLSESQGRELLADWKANQKGRVENPKLPHVPKSQFEQDAESFEKFLRQRDSK